MSNNRLKTKQIGDGPGLATEYLDGTGSFTATGSVGNVITLNSLTAATPWILQIASGYVNCDYLSLQDSTAQGGANFYAGANSTNVSGNTGWQFSGHDAATSHSFFLSN